MIWYSTYNEMVRLYSLYERRFFRDLANIICRRFPLYQHTFLECTEQEVHKLSSNISDKDEVQFLIRALSKERALVKSLCFQLSDQRTDIKNHSVFTLELIEGQVLGYWIVESRHIKNIFGKRKMKKYARFLSLLLQAQRDKESVVRNLEMDELVCLPNNMAFIRHVQKLQVQGVAYCICILRIEDYRLRVKCEGDRPMKEQVADLVNKVKLATLGDNFIVSEDTVAVISHLEMKDLYAQLYAFADDNKLWETTKLVLVPSNFIQTGDVLKIMETAMGLCKTGMIWRYGKDGIASLCVSEGSTGS